MILQRVFRFPGLATLCLAVFLSLLAGGAQAAKEEILDYDVQVDVGRDSVIEVTEKIKVWAQGWKIKRGIFRDIPLLFETEDGLARAGFELVSAQRDGQTEASRVQQMEGGVRIYLGQADVMLDPGIYTYTIVYRMTWQVRFFEDHDEIYWNVTGNNWVFPIDAATALVRLPQGVTANEIIAYTGKKGAKGADYTAEEKEGGNSVRFRTTKPLLPGQGISVVVTFAKGEVTPPQEPLPLVANEPWYQSFDSGYRFVPLGQKEGFAIAGITLVTLFYLVCWWLYGRDPEAGVVYPRFEAPGDLSPALVNYVDRDGFSTGHWTAVSAAALNLAVKGYLELIEGDGADLTLKLTGKGREAIEGATSRHDLIPSGERVLLERVAAENGRFRINKTNGPEVRKLGQAFSKAIRAEDRGKFYIRNSGLGAIGFLMSIAAVVCTGFAGGASDVQKDILMISCFISVFPLAIAVIFGSHLRQSRGFSGSSKTALGVGLGAAFVLVVIGAGLAMTFTYATPQPITLGVLLVINVFFFFILGAPTPHGQQKKDEINGLYMYLSVAEAEQMNMPDQPRMSPERFEKLLPYAVALHVEKPWAEAFERWLRNAASVSEARYQPTWRRGSTFNSNNVAGSLASVTSGMSSSFSVAVPTSSGSGGGGSSGGGGGGGGGGGW